MLVAEPSQRLSQYYSFDLDSCAGPYAAFSPPAWFSGGFLRLMNAAPAIGVDVICRLSQYLARCQAALHIRDDEPAEEVAIDFDSTIVRWAGDEKLFQAYRNLGHAPDAIVSALMAMECYFYDALSRDEDCSSLLTTALRNGGVPVAGVLTTVGRFRPYLFAGPLRPLLGVAEFLVWDWNLATLREDRYIADMGLVIRSPSLLEVSREWAAMEHRSANLMDVARTHFMTGEHAFFEPVVRRWRAEYKGDRPWPSTFPLDHLLQFFDRANYRETSPDGEPSLEYVPPQAAADAETAAVANQRLRLLTGPRNLLGLLKRRAPQLHRSATQYFGCCGRAVSPGSTPAQHNRARRTTHTQRRSPARRPCC